MEPRETKRMILELKDHPDKAREEVDRWTEALAVAVRPPADRRRLCEYGRLLTFATILAAFPQHSDLWVEGRIRRVLQLLVEAVEASTGSRSHLNCMDRPRDFLDGLAAACEGNRRIEECISKLERENAEAVERGIPILNVT